MDKSEKTPEHDSSVSSLSWQQRSEAKLSKFFERLKSRRVDLFVEKLALGPDDLVLDLGSEDGSYLAKYYPYPENVIIADIHEEPMKKGVEKYGLHGYRQLNPDGPLPFADKEFRAVWCNSVIEHVTVPRDQLGTISSADFVRRADEHQQQFAREIMRVAQSYFVQTPNKHFPVESHSIMPLVAYLPHTIRFKISRAVKRFWIKQWTSDFYLYNRKRFVQHYPDATEILEERALGLSKSLIAVRHDTDT